MNYTGCCLTRTEIEVSARTKNDATLSPPKFSFTGCANGVLISRAFRFYSFYYDGGEPFAESGPISIGNGDNVMSVTQMIPDEKSQGDVDATFKTRFYPNDVERSYGPFNMSNPVSLRFTGRQVRIRIEAENGLR